MSEGNPKAEDPKEGGLRIPRVPIAVTVAALLSACVQGNKEDGGPNLSPEAAMTANKTYEEVSVYHSKNLLTAQKYAFDQQVLRDGAMVDIPAEVRSAAIAYTDAHQGFKKTEQWVQDEIRNVASFFPQLSPDTTLTELLTFLNDVDNYIGAFDSMDAQRSFGEAVTKLKEIVPQHESAVLYANASLTNLKQMLEDFDPAAAKKLDEK